MEDKDNRKRKAKRSWPKQIKKNGRGSWNEVEGGCTRRETGVGGWAFKSFSWGRSQLRPLPFAAHYAKAGGATPTWFESKCFVILVSWIWYVQFDAKVKMGDAAAAAAAHPVCYSRTPLPHTHTLPGPNGKSVQGLFLWQMLHTSVQRRRCCFF